MKKTKLIAFRATETQRRRLERLAAERQVSISRVITALIDHVESEEPTTVAVSDVEKNKGAVNSAKNTHSAFVGTN